MIGTKLAHYEITSHLGTGGMGEVYQATDAKLGRSVAIKFLPETFSHDNERVARFEREARVLASLNHPNIAAIFGLEEGGDRKFLVMELVEGETLAERIKRGPILVEESLGIAKQICEALEAAHEKGIIHRDLKPANVKITLDGKVKVLDFGLAKAMEQAPTTTPSNSPTLISVAASNAGVILGTAAYMSPEQAKGKTVDRRADIWAFGVVLYEMLTGRMLFSGETVSETMAFVMTKEPDWNALPANTPGRVRTLLRRCLTKEPQSRLRDIGEARIAIEDTQSGAADGGVPQTPSRRRSKVPVGIAAVLLSTMIASFATLSVFYFNRAAPPEIRLEMNTPPTSDPFSVAISPDERKVVFSALNEGRPQLWIRPLDSLTAQPLPGTEGATLPFWSPDSASFGFFAESKLKRIDIGGAPQVLATATCICGGGTWNRDGVILFMPSSMTPVSRIPATGGQPIAVTRLENGQAGHRSPRFLPDGRHFIYFAQGGANQGLYIGSLDEPTSKRLANVDPGAAMILPAGIMLFSRQATLFAQVFDSKNQQLSGSPFPVAEQSAGFSATANVLAYRRGSTTDRSQMTWLDRSGKTVGTVGVPDVNLRDVELSPDEKRVAVWRSINGNNDVWLIDAVRGAPTRFTFDPASDSRPLWSPDGSRLAWGSDRNGIGLYFKRSSGAGSDELLVRSDTSIGMQPSDWSSDGRFLLFRSADSQTGYDLWVLPLSGDKKPFPFLKIPFDQRDGQFSPDGKWIAYQSNESGQFEIYLQSFPGPGGKFQISTNGGAQPRWNKNGKEIFYVSLDSKMMAAPIKLSPDGQSLEVGAAVALFAVRIAGGPLQGTAKQQYAVSSDGQRFLFNLATDEGTTSPITIIYNWKPPAK